MKNNSYKQVTNKQAIKDMAFLQKIIDAMGDEYDTSGLFQDKELKNLGRYYLVIWEKKVESQTKKIFQYQQILLDINTTYADIEHSSIFVNNYSYEFCHRLTNLKIKFFETSRMLREREELGNMIQTSTKNKKTNKI